MTCSWVTSAGATARRRREVCPHLSSWNAAGLPSTSLSPTTLSAWRVAAELPGSGRRGRYAVYPPPSPPLPHGLPAHRQPAHCSTCPLLNLPTAQPAHCSTCPLLNLPTAQPAHCPAHATLKAARASRPVTVTVHPTGATPIWPSGTRRGGAHCWC
eukprot:scaffold15824_cov123-Isochrysis_galbana.AAC.1